MFETMDAARGVGLAAPQVGVGLRIFTWQLTNDDGIPPAGRRRQPLPHLRPSRSSATPTRTTRSRAACRCRASPSRCAGASRRRSPGSASTASEIRYEATGWFARMLQHEYDHLNGFLYVDRLTGQVGAQGDARRSRRTAGACPGCRGCRAWTATRSATTTRRPRTSASTDVDRLVVGVVGPTATGKSDLAIALAAAAAAARSSAPTPRSSTAGWTSAPPRCPPDERHGIAAPPARRPRRDRGGQRRRLPAARPGRHRRPCWRRGALPRRRRRVRALRAGRPRPARDPADRPRGAAPASRTRLDARGDRGRCSPSCATSTPAAADAIEPNNGRRVVRALEVVELTGRPFSATMPTREFVRPTVLVGLRTDRDGARRAGSTAGPARMFDAGLVDETRALVGARPARGTHREPRGRLRPGARRHRRHDDARGGRRRHRAAHPAPRAPAGVVVRGRPADHLVRGPLAGPRRPRRRARRGGRVVGAARGQPQWCAWLTG